MTDRMQTVQGRCPACGWTSLFLGDGGHVTCSRLECPNPCDADQLLHGEHVGAATPLVCSDERHAAKVADLERQLAHVREECRTWAEAESTDIAAGSYAGRVEELEAEVARLRAGEEPGWDPLLEPTPGQWIACWNQASPEERLDVAKRAMANGGVAERCALMAHEKRLADAEAAIARVRKAIDSIHAVASRNEPATSYDHGFTTARDWVTMRVLEAIDARLVNQPAPAAATQATDTQEQPPLAIPHDMATTLHRTLGQLLGDQDAQAIARLRALHREEYGACAECTHAISVLWPCPTIRALDGEQPDA